MTAAGIAEGLRLIRIRQRRMLYVFLGFLPAMLAAGWISNLFTASETPLIYALLAYGALFFAYSLRLALTECPRCEGLYHWSWWANPWTRRCLNCGLPLKAN